MTAPKDPYGIRLARLDETSRLREIEDQAGTLFSGLGLIDETLDVSFPPEELARLIGIGQVWVACTANDVPIGVVIASLREGSVYVEEIDVLPAHGRRGLGGRLLARVCAWAQEQGHLAVTLSTFRDVPWNGPFYRKHAFKDLTPAQWTPGMRAIRESEERHGLQVEARVFMRRELGRDLSQHAVHFDAFGFALLQRFADVEALSAELDACMSDAFAEPSHMNAGAAGNQFRYVPTMCERTPRSLALLRQLAPVASAILQAPVLPSRAKATTYRGSTKWHRDSDSSLKSVGFLFYLEPVDAENGALRVLPGSHWADYAAAIEPYVTTAEVLPGVAIPTLPGDAIALDERLFHASAGGDERRQWRVDFVADLPGTDQALRDYFARQYTPGWDGGYDVERYPSYGKYWRTLDAGWSRRLDELGAYEAAAAEEEADCLRSKAKS